MASIADIVMGSKSLDISQGLVLLVPQSLQQQDILMEARGKMRGRTNKFLQVDPEQILRKVIGSEDRLKNSGWLVYLVAPGDWNGSEEKYYALVCGNGMTILSSLESCGYELHNGKLTNVADLELS